MLTLTEFVSILIVTDNVSWKEGEIMVHDNLKRIRIAMGVTQSHLAKKINVTNMTYSRIENGESKLDVERLQVLAKSLGIDVSIFFDDKLTESVVYVIKNNNFQEKQLA